MITKLQNMSEGEIEYRQDISGPCMDYISRVKVKWSYRLLCPIVF